jgi:hypothetical protein
MGCAPNADRLLANVNSKAVVESWILCTVVFNIVATGLLAWRILGNRQTRLTFRASGQSSRVQAVLAVLTESAFLYTASGVVFMALYLVNSPAKAIFRALFNNLAVRSSTYSLRALLSRISAVLEPCDHCPARCIESSHARRHEPSCLFSFAHVSNRAKPALISLRIQDPSICARAARKQTRLRQGTSEHGCLPGCLSRDCWALLSTYSRIIYSSIAEYRVFLHGTDPLALGVHRTSTSRFSNLETQKCKNRAAQHQAAVIGIDGESRFLATMVNAVAVSFTASLQRPLHKRYSLGRGVTLVDIKRKI